MSEWERIDWRDTPVKLDWWDCTTGFYCLCGSAELLQASDESDTETCDACGRTYRMVTYLEVQPPPAGVSAEGAAWAMEGAHNPYVNVGNPLWDTDPPFFRPDKEDSK